MNNKKTSTHMKLALRLILGLFMFQQLFVASLIRPATTRPASLTTTSATLSNPRLSFYGKLNGAYTAGANIFTIESSGNPDNDTTHLFPNDIVSIGPNPNKTVTTISGTQTFIVSAGITVGALNEAAVYATQSGSLTISTTLTSAIPANGYVKVTLPDPPTNGNDGAPDSTSDLATNGFDLNNMATTDVAVTGGTGCTWSGTETLTAGDGTTGHIYTAVTTTQCTGGTITITFDGSPGLVNPAPVTNSRDQGTGDVYSLSIGTYDGSNNPIDSARALVAPVEGVLVSATVLETMSFEVDGVNSGATACGQTTDVTTTAYGVPFGDLNTSNSFYDAAQLLTVSTNGDDGYIVRVHENDALSKDGAGTTYIADTTCNTGLCTHTTAAEWTTASNNGLGYTLADTSGTDAKFNYNDGTFLAKHFPNITAGATEYSDTDAEIMSNDGPVSGSAANICFRLSISGVQAAGYYYNKVKYIATPRF